MFDICFVFVKVSVLFQDVIFHNEAYSNSNSSGEESLDSPDDKKRSPSPKKGSSFVTAILSAIKNAAAQTPFAHISKNSIGQ